MKFANDKWLDQGLYIPLVYSEEVNWNTSGPLVQEKKQNILLCSQMMSQLITKASNKP